MTLSKYKKGGCRTRPCPRACYAGQAARLRLPVLFLACTGPLSWPLALGLRLISSIAAISAAPHAPGGDRDHPVLAQALARVRASDTLVVVSLDRLARSLSHLLVVIEGLHARAAFFRSLRDPVDTASPQGLFTLQVLGATAQLERALVHQKGRPLAWLDWHDYGNRSRVVDGSRRKRPDTERRR
jgi:hypothetical protein